MFWWLGGLCCAVVLGGEFELAAIRDEGTRGTGACALVVEVLRAALRERAAGVHPEEKGVGTQLLLGRIKRTCGEDLS